MAGAPRGSKPNHPRAPTAKRPVSTGLQSPPSDPKRQRLSKHKNTTIVKLNDGNEITETRSIPKSDREGSVLNPSINKSSERPNHPTAILRNKTYQTPKGRTVHESFGCARDGPRNKSTQNRLFCFDSDSDSDAARDSGSPRPRHRDLTSTSKTATLNTKGKAIKNKNQGASAKAIEPIDLTLTPATATSTLSSNGLLLDDPDANTSRSLPSSFPRIQSAPMRPGGPAKTQHRSADQPDFAVVSTSLHNVVKSLLPKAEALRDVHVTNAPNLFRRNPEINYVLEGLEHDSVSEHCKQKLAAIEAAREAMRCLKRAEKLEEHTKRVRELRRTFENSQALKITDVTDLISVMSRDMADCKDWKEL
ncbi:hypothetical protein BDV19DRAFT_392074 [Aspergillus venezuelensis]